MKKIKGFTLVELVIVIAIVIILSVVSVPIYRGYSRNAKMAEGYALLGTILSAQKIYYSQYGNFLFGSQGNSSHTLFTANDELLGIDARGNKYFTYFSVDTHSGAKDWFAAYVAIPEELMLGNKKVLRLSYNVTKGATFLESGTTVLD